MTAKELIKAYNIKLTVKWDGTKYAPTGTLMITDGVACRRAGDLDAVKAAKPEILAVLMAEREAEERADQERQEKINEDMAYALSYLSIYNNRSIGMMNMQR